MSKAKGGVENKKWEAVGDALIDLILAENLDRLPKEINGVYAPHYLSSNDHLSLVRDSCNFPITFKYPNRGTEYEKKNTSKVRKGDEVEYYVAFLYFNHGLEKVREFLLDNLFTINFLKNETVSS